MMLIPDRGFKQLEMGWGCAACRGRETYGVEEVQDLGGDGSACSATRVISRPDLKVCAKCGLLFMAEIIAEKNS